MATDACAPFFLVHELPRRNWGIPLATCWRKESTARNVVRLNQVSPNNATNAHGLLSIQFFIFVVNMVFEAPDVVVLHTHPEGTEVALRVTSARPSTCARCGRSPRRALRSAEKARRQFRIVGSNGRRDFVTSRSTQGSC